MNFKLTLTYEDSGAPVDGEDVAWTVTEGQLDQNGNGRTTNVGVLEFTCNNLTRVGVVKLVTASGEGETNAFARARIEKPVTLKRLIVVPVLAAAQVLTYYDIADNNT